jgi:surfeit locus 1 family protein
MIAGSRRFHPPWWAYLLTAVGVSLFTALGFWQLERAALKERIETRFESRLAGDYQSLASYSENGDLEYRKLLLRGRFDNEHNLLVDNQLHRGRAGYYILTPLLLADSERIVLVNRGWAPWGESRDVIEPILPAVAVDGVAGIAYFPSEPALQLGAVESGKDWPRLLSHIDIDALQQGFDGRLEPWVLWLAPEWRGEYVRDWNPVWMRPEKSRAYAAQWFAFALLALLFFVILNLRKIE